jgi:hypothetical protein
VRCASPSCIDTLGGARCRSKAAPRTPSSRWTSPRACPRADACPLRAHVRGVAPHECSSPATVTFIRQDLATWIRSFRPCALPRRERGRPNAVDQFQAPEDWIQRHDRVGQPTAGRQPLRRWMSKRAIVGARGERWHARRRVSAWRPPSLASSFLRWRLERRWGLGGARTFEWSAPRRR